MAGLVNLSENVNFVKMIKIGDDIIEDDESVRKYEPGSIRFNNITGKFEGYHYDTGTAKNALVLDGVTYPWREFTSNIATTTELGTIKVGTNLSINPTTGVLSSLALGESRINQRIITISGSVGTADYQSITTAINNAIGTPGNYNGGSITSVYGEPTLTNQYILLVGPGEYIEKVNLPPFVSLIGEGINRTFIKLFGGSNTVENGALISAGKNCGIQNLTLNLDSNGESICTGIYSNSNNNIYLNNVKIIDSGTGSTSNTIGIYSSKANNYLVENTNISFNLGDDTIIGGFFNNGIGLDIKNSNIHIKANSSDNKGIFIDNFVDSGITHKNNYLVGNKLEIYNGNENYGIFHNNADSIISASKIIIDGDFNNDTDVAYGITLSASNPINSVTSTELQFINNSSTDGNDVIYLTSTSTNNFITDNFVDGRIIKVSGASNSENNGYFTISKVTANSLTLNESAILKNENAGSSITIKQVYNVESNHNTIKATSNGTAISNSIAVLDNSGNCNFEIYNNKLIGGPPSGNPTTSGTTSRIVFNNVEEIIVGPRNADFRLVSEAINSIQDSNSNKRYCITVLPGNYTEISKITCKRYVSIKGTGASTTNINFAIANTTLNNGTCFELASDMNISDITITNNSSSSENGSHSMCLYGNNKNNFKIVNCKLVVSGSPKKIYGAYFDTCIYESINNEFEISADSNSNEAYGIYQTDSTNTNHSSNITITGETDTLNSGIYNKDTNMLIYSPKINVSGSDVDNNNEGITCISDDAGDYIIQLFNGEIISTRVINLEDNYSLIANSTRLEGIVNYNDSDTDTNLRCNNCYKIEGTTSKTYKPLNIYGSDDTSLNNLVNGNNSGNQNISGENNTLLGVNSGNSLDEGDRNTIVGSSSGKLTEDGGDNTFIGFSAGFNTLNASNNTFVGSNVGIRNTSGGNNTYIGRNAGFDNTNGNNNTIMGESSAYKLAGGNDNVMVGQGSGFNTTSGNRNTFIGGGSSSNIGAGYSNTTGNDNTYIGYQSGKSGTIAIENVFIGKQAGYNNTSSNNVFIGHTTGYTNTSGTDNVFIGNSAAYTNNDGNDNVILGNQAGYKMTSGEANILLGSQAGYNITIGERNIALGSVTTNLGSDSAGYSLKSGGDNIMIGSKSGKKLNTADRNVFIGSNTGSSITGNGDNILIGMDAGCNLTSANNVLIGYKAGESSVENTDNVMLGNQSGQNSRGSNKSVFIGKGSGLNNQGDNNTFIGYEAGNGDTGTESTGSDNVAIGAYVGTSIRTGKRNILFGSGGGDSDSAGASITTGNDNIIFGYKAGKLMNASNNSIIGTESGMALTSGSGNLLIGYQSGANETSGNYNILVGFEAGKNQVAQNNNIYMGYKAGHSNTEGNGNIGIGTETSYSNSEGNNNTNIGYHSGYNSTGSNNINFGYEAGVSSTTGETNMFMGYQSAGKDRGSGTKLTGNFNIGIGQRTAYNITEGNRNVFVGNGAGYYSTSGNKNIFMGNLTGFNNTEGSRNVFIGNSDSDDSNGIGFNNTTGNFNVFMGSNVGLSNTEGNENIMIGSDAGNNNTTGDDNIYIGTSSGKNGTIAKNNIMIGNEVGKPNVSGDDNIYIGNKAGLEINTNNEKNIVIGSEAGQNLEVNNIIAIGTQAGQSNTSGDENIYIGKQSGKNIQTGGKNIFIGSETGKQAVSDTSFVTVIGSDAFNNTGGSLSASNVIIIGSEAGTRMIGNADDQYKGNNISIGVGSCNQMTTGNNNISLGNDTIRNGNTSNSIVIGFEAGQNVNGFDNIIFGNNAGAVVSSGIGNIIMGNQALQMGNTSNTIAIGFKAASNSSVSGDNNIFMGVNSGHDATTGESNIVIGSNSGYKLTSGSTNIFMGQNAGYYASTGGNNIAIGKDSMMAESNEGYLQDNIFMGTESGKIIRYGNYNIGVGSRNLINFLNGSSNVSFGADTLLQMERGNNNTFIGDFAGSSISTSTESNNNVGIGSNSLNNLQQGDNNIGIGAYALSSGTEIYDNTIAIGYEAGYNSSTSNNIFIGTEAGMNNGTGLNNINIGYRSGYGVFGGNSGSDNVIVGTNSGYSINGAASNILFGNNAGYNIVSGESNINIGKDAGYYFTINDFNTFIGYEAGKGTQSWFDSGDYTNTNGTTEDGKVKGDANLFVGYRSGYSLTSGYQNVGLGYQAGKELTTGRHNNFIGFEAGVACTTGNNNSCIGFHSGKEITTGKENTLITTGAGLNITTGNRNLVFGYDSYYKNKYSDENVFIGYKSGHGSSSDSTYNSMSASDGCFNIGIGSNVALNIEEGKSNIIFGKEASYHIETGSNNCVIGYNSAYTSSNTNKGISIGDNTGYLSRNFNDSILIGEQAGRGANNRDDTNNIYIGKKSGYSVNGDNNILLTTSGGENSVTFSDIFAVYKDNEHNNSGTPLLFGDINNKILAINTTNFGLTPSDSTVRLVVNGSAKANAFTPFTGVHIVNTANTNPIIEGQICSSNGTVNKNSIIDVKATIDISQTENDKNVYGVYCGTETNVEEDITNKYIDNVVEYGKRYNYYTNSEGEQTSNIITDVITSDTNRTLYYEFYTVNEMYEDPNYTPSYITNINHNIASLGEGQILVTNINGNIENGDYISSSNIAGYGMKQNDDLLHNYTVAKCIETVDWNNITDTISHSGNDYKYYSIGCTYHCG